MSGVCRKPRPNGRFQGWYIDSRGRQKNFIGTRNRASTRDLAEQLEDQARPARLGLTGTTALQSAGLPIDKIIKEYLSWGAISGGRGRRPWSATHARMRKTHLEFWQKHIGIKISDLSAALPIVERELTNLQRQGLKRKTLANYSEALASFCDFCLKREYILTDPLKRLAKIDTSPERIRSPLNPEEIKKLLSVAPEHRCLLYEVAFASGLRVNELMQLEENDLDIQRGGIKLHAEWTKNRKKGFQPLHPQIVCRLQASISRGDAKAFYAHTGRCVPHKRNIPKNPLLYVPSHPARDLEKDLKKAGIKKVRPDGSIIDFHSSRNAYVTMIGIITPVIKEQTSLARHANANMTIGLYAKTTDDRLRDIARAVGDNFLFSTVSKKAHAPAMKEMVGAAGFEPATSTVIDPIVHKTNAQSEAKTINIIGQIETLPIGQIEVSENCKRSETQKPTQQHPLSITGHIRLRDGTEISGLMSEVEVAGKKFVTIAGQMICPSEIVRIQPEAK